MVAQMITSVNRLSGKRMGLLGLLFLTLLLGSGCGGSRPGKPGEWLLGFQLKLPPEFHASGGLFPTGGGTMYFLRGEEPDQPRLTVRMRRLRMELSEHLAEELEITTGAVVLEEEEIRDVAAVNATGLGKRLTVKPFPLIDSTLVLLYDVRVFPRGDDVLAFIWQQDPADKALLAQWEAAAAKLILGESPPQDSTLVHEDAPPAVSGPQPERGRPSFSGDEDGMPSGAPGAADSSAAEPRP